MIGKTISHYRIIEKLGEGGMGIVYKAEDTKLKRTVALKFLPHHLLANEEDKTRFLHEAQSASALNHPNIMTIHEIDEVDEQTFIAMEYIDGDNLKDKLEKGHLKTKELLNIAIAVADGLNAAHEQEIVHRDIKSENIMISKTGLVKIMDFGLAKRKGMSRVTKTGSTLGTLAYMSPEQVEGLDVDRRCDLFSFGVVMYEMATGQLPFKGEHDAAILYSIVNEAPLLVTTLNPNIPQELERFIHKALEKEVEDRYQHADDLSADLRKLKKDLESKRTISSTVQFSVPTVLEKKPLRVADLKRKWWVVVSGVTVVLVVAYALFVRFPTKPELEHISRVKMLAVLPFENLGSPEDEYFADGITEEIISRISAIHGLGVIARTSAMQYKNTNKSIQQISQELGVDYILEGSIRWQQFPEGLSRVRITPQLIWAADATHLWSSVYDKDMSDIFLIQTDIAEQVAKALDIKLLEPERKALQAKPTNNQEAYDFYLRGIDYNDRGWSTGNREEFYLAVEAYKKATELDPDFALAYVGLSFVHSWLYFDGYDQTEERLARSKVAVDEALRLKPDMPEALLTLGFYYYRAFLDYERALDLFERVQRVRPNTPPYIPAYIQRRQGKWQQSVKNLEKVFNLDPRSAITADQQGLSYTYMRRYKEAEEWYNRALSIDPDYHSARISKAWNYLLWKGNTTEVKVMLETIPTHPYVDQIWLLLHTLERNYEEAIDLLNSLAHDSFESQNLYFDKNLAYASLYYLQGEPLLVRSYADSARANLEKMVRERPADPRFHSTLGLAYAYLDEKDKAIREANRAVELYPVSKDALGGSNYIFNLVQVYTIVGQIDSAIDQLQYLLSIPSNNISVSLLKLDPFWDPLRDHPRFQKLIKADE